MRAWRSIRDEARAARADPALARWGRVIAVTMLLAGGLDAASTEIALATGGAAEANPLIRAVQNAFGSGWIAVKMTAHMLLAAAVMWYPNKPTLVAMGVVTLITAAVTANNIAIYRSIIAGV